MTVAGPLEVIAVAVLAWRRLGPGWRLLVLPALLPTLLWSLPPQPCGCIRTPFVRCLDTWPRAHRAAMMSDLKNLASQQEIHWSDVGAYSADPTTLRFTHSQGVRVHIEVSEDGWGAIATHDGLEAASSCAMFVGSTPPSGIGIAADAPPGELACTF